MTSDLSRWATWREIHAQPEVWAHWGAAFDGQAARQWIAQQSFDEVWFCGAGTSAYIGDIIAASFEGRAEWRVRSVPSTDLVNRPDAYLTGRTPLVVSFGRSGNSSETVGTLAALDALAPAAPRVNITCNADSALATHSERSPTHTIVLPEAAHDAGFAMTSSFSTMLLTALTLFDSELEFDTNTGEIGQILAGLLPEFTGCFASMPERAVYLGTGPLAFAAREAALKVMELSAGRVPALWDSTLGFRHGPKSFITDNTLITQFVSGDTHARRYEDDLTKELSVQFPKARLVTIGPGGGIEIPSVVQMPWSTPLYVASAQVAGVLWSDALGLNVDDPFAGQGTLSRVVSGVTLYPVAP